MKATAVPVNDPAPVALADVERELARQLRAVEQPGEAPVQRACMSNLVVFCDQLNRAERVVQELPDVVAMHPARVLLLVADPALDVDDLAAVVHVQAYRVGERILGSEQVTLLARGPAVAHLPYAQRSLVIGDLPTNLWWAAAQPPALAGDLLYELAEHAEQVIYDSIGWLDPPRGVAATASWLEKFERGPGQGPWRVASDLNWRRLKYWRRLLGQALDPASAPGAAESITELLVEHGPHAVVQAWELASWLASRLGWRAQTARVQPNVEITWQLAGPAGPVRLRIHRLAEGPSEVRRLRLACTVAGKPGALELVVQDERRLAVIPEGADYAPRTLTVQPQRLADLVARQLSDRERDPVFRESMAVAEVLARSVLGS